MDRRELSRINIKFGKFLDPFLILTIIAILTVSIFSVRSLSPRIFSQEQKTHVLGIQEDSEIKLKLLRGEHQYINSENLKEITSTHFKYSTLVKKPPQGRISKPILSFEDLHKETNLKIQLNYTNSANSKISIFDESKQTKYILQDNSQNYFQNIKINEKTKNLYLVIENRRPVFFNQYVELSFFLNL